MSDSSRPHGLQPTRLLHPWDFPGKSTGVGCHCLLHLGAASSFNPSTSDVDKRPGLHNPGQAAGCLCRAAVSPRQGKGKDMASAHLQDQRLGRHWVLPRSPPDVSYQTLSVPQCLGTPSWMCLRWLENSFGFFCNSLWKNLIELFGQPGVKSYSNLFFNTRKILMWFYIFNP